MILRNPHGRSKTRPTKKKTFDTRHMVKIQAESPEAEHFEFRCQRIYSLFLQNVYNITSGNNLNKSQSAISR
ncbi:hypothetical protein G5I_10843 [Acromyrmex echinatior]|uniref:Uncharacterized protein n=1 Tax=Acromyrmex echinatior TaxID=103372 RepID=F4WXY8_ACREC|nr:hypothetical protein G5I_10843 [Acromyrmex echinatior]